MATRRGMQLGMMRAKCSGYSRLTEVELRSNGAGGMTIRGQEEDVFFLNRGDGMHGGYCCVIIC